MTKNDGSLRSYASEHRLKFYTALLGLVVAVIGLVTLIINKWPDSRPESTRQEAPPEAQQESNWPSFDQTKPEPPTGPPQPTANLRDSLPVNAYVNSAVLTDPERTLRFRGFEGQFVSLNLWDRDTKASLTAGVDLVGTSRGSSASKLLKDQPHAGVLFRIDNRDIYRLSFSSSHQGGADTNVHIRAYDDSVPDRVLGGSTVVMGELSTEGEVDLYSIQTKRGDRLLILFTIPEEKGILGLRVFTPSIPISINTIPPDTFGVAEVMAPSDDKLVLALHGSGDIPFPYQLGIKRLEPPLFLEKTDNSIPGNIDFIGDSSVFKFKAGAGSHWDVKLACHNDLKAIMLLVAPDDSPLTRLACQQGADATYVVEDADEGPYTIRVASPSGSVGSFTLSVRMI